jgi:integrase
MLPTDTRFRFYTRNGKPELWADVHISIKGKKNRYRFPTNTTNTAIASEYAINYINELCRIVDKRQWSIDEVCGKWRTEITALGRNTDTVTSESKIITEYFGKNTPFNSITSGMVHDFTMYLLEKRKVKTSTVNNYLALLSVMINRAKRNWDILYPDINIRDHMLPKPAPKNRRIPDDDLQLIYKKANKILKLYMEIDCGCGLRKSNVLELTWENNINLAERTITVLRKNPQVQGREPLTVGMTKALADRLSKIENKSGYVIKLRGKPIKDIKTAWHGALSRAKISGKWRIHDLRHTFAQNMLKGSNTRAVQEQLGHHSEYMTRVYTQFLAQDKVNALDNVKMPELGTKKGTIK